MSVTYCDCVFCTFLYRACNAHAPYCQLWPARLYDIFPRYLIRGRIFGGEKVIEHKTCVLILSTTFAWKKFLILRRIERDQNCISVFMYSAGYFGHILMKLEFSQIFMKIRPVGAGLFHMDRQTEMTKLIFAFRNFPNAPKGTEQCIIIQKSLKLISNISDVKFT
jgi:hypothetical protein